MFAPVSSPRVALGLLALSGVLLMSGCNVDHSLWGLACERGHAKGCWRMGQHARDNGADEQAQQALFAKACAGGWPPACTDEGLLLERRTDEPGPERARVLYTGACEWGDPGACHNLGRMLRHREPRDFKEAARLFEKGCELGVEESCESLALIRMRLELPLEDRAEARRELASRCKGKETPRPCAQLAAAELAGLGGSRQAARAARRLAQACPGFERACKLKDLTEDKPEREQVAWARCFLGGPVSECLEFAPTNAEANEEVGAGILGVLKAPPAGEGGEPAQKSSSSSTLPNSRSRER